MSSIKYKSKKLIGNKVTITAKNSSGILPLVFEPFSFQAVLQDVNDSYITIKKQSGMVQTMPFKDKYITIENIE